MKTELEINEAAVQRGVFTHGNKPSEGRVHFRVGFIDGANWMLKQQPGWIPVTERLPDVNKPVLVALKGRVTGKDMFKVDEYIDKEWRYTTSGFITHWMPLPDAP